jgi:hypothetical protein
MKPKINEISDINIAVGVGKTKMEYNCLLQKRENEIMECIQLAKIKKIRRHAVEQLLRHCATKRKAAGSIPDCVIGIFH